MRRSGRVGGEGKVVSGCSDIESENSPQIVRSSDSRLSAIFKFGAEE